MRLVVPPHDLTRRLAQDDVDIAVGHLTAEHFLRARTPSQTDCHLGADGQNVAIGKPEVQWVRRTQSRARIQKRDGESRGQADVLLDGHVRYLAQLILRR